MLLLDFSALLKNTPINKTAYYTLIVDTIYLKKQQY